jgi:hypothetical protein
MGWKIDLWLSAERKSSDGSVNAPSPDEDEIQEDGEKIRTYRSLDSAATSAVRLANF